MSEPGYYAIVCAANEVGGQEQQAGEIYFAPADAGEIPADVTAQRAAYEAACSTLRNKLGVTSDESKKVFTQLLAGAQLLRGKTPNVAEAKKALDAVYRTLAQSPAPPASTPPPPAWVLVVGVSFLGVTLLFLMYMVAAPGSIPCDKRDLVVFIVAMSAAAGSAFLGGSLVAQGRIPIKFLKEHPIEFSAAGGIAVLVVVIVLGHHVYACELPPQKLIEIQGTWNVPGYGDRVLSCTRTDEHVNCFLDNLDFKHSLNGDYQSSSRVSGILERTSVSRADCRWSAIFVIQLVNEATLDLQWDVTNSVPGCDLPVGSHLDDRGYRRVSAMPIPRH